MIPIKFKEQMQVIGGNKDIHHPKVPVKIIIEPLTRVFSCWKPSKEDLEILNKGGCVWMSQITARNPFQATILQIEKPDFKKIDEQAKKDIKAMVEELNRQAQNKKSLKANNPVIDPDLRRQIKKSSELKMELNKKKPKK